MPCRLRSQRRHELDELFKEFLQLGVENEHLFAFAKALLQQAKIDCDRFKAAAQARAKVQLEKQNKIVYRRRDDELDRTIVAGIQNKREFQTSDDGKKGGNVKENALGLSDESKKRARGSEQSAR